MDFIERIFHLSPDNGDGSFEAMLLLVLLLLVAFAIRGFLRRSRRLMHRAHGPSRRARTAHHPPAIEPGQATRTG